MIIIIMIIITVIYNQLIYLDKDTHFNRDLSLKCWSIFDKTKDIQEQQRNDLKDILPFILFPIDEKTKFLMENVGPYEEYMWEHKKQKGLVYMPIIKEEDGMIFSQVK